MKIEKIIFYEETINGKIEKKSLVFFDNGQIGSGSYDQGIKAIEKYAKENNCSSMNELKKEMQKNIVVLSEKQYKSKIIDMINSHKDKYDIDEKNSNTTSEATTENEFKEEQTEKNNIDTEKQTKEDNIDEEETIEEVKDTKKSKLLRKVKKLTLFAGIALLGVFGVKSCKNNLEQKQAESTKNNDKNQDENLNESSDNYSSIEEALNKAYMNETKKKAVSSIWSYLNHYNNTYSNYHASDKNNTKLAHKWNEVVSNYLAYNKLSKDELTKIFDTTVIDSDSMIKAYKNSIKQDIQAYTVQSTELGKESLFKSQKGQEFYSKYEKLLILFNTTSKDSDKIRKAEDFYQELHRDFDFKKENIADYKLSIMPMVKAMNNMSKKLDLSNKLTSSEKEYIDDMLLSDVVASKFADYEQTLSTYNIATSALNEQTNEISYIDLKKLGIKELKELNAYNVSASDRDISNHKEYKDNSNVKLVSTENDNSNASNTKSNQEQNKSKKTDTKQKKKSDTKKDKITNKIEKVDVIVDDTNDDNYNIESDTATGPAITINDDGMDHSDDNNNSDTVANDNSEDKVGIDDNYKDENGNLDNSVVDVTDDKTDVNNSPLPDPNATEEPVATIVPTETPATETNDTNEAVATEIVENMAENPTPTEDVAKTLTK